MMTDSRNTRVIIVGAGIGGLTAALALQRADFDVMVFERARDWRNIQVGGGIHLWNNAMHAMQTLGLADEVRAIGSSVEHAEFRSRHGRLLADWPIGDIERQMGLPTVGVARPDLQHVLVEALGDDVVHLNCECTGFSQDASGVTVQFADGSETRGDVLIGADGIRSAIRARQFGTVPARYAGYAVWQAIVDFQHSNAPVGIFRVLWGPGSRFAFYHVGGQRLYWFCVLNTVEGGTGVNKVDLLTTFKGWMEPVEAIIQATEPKAISRADHYDRPPISTWGEGRVTLLGDAAHPMTFNVGQGACQAIEDAIVLAKCLGQDKDVAQALRRYEAKRMPRTASIQKRAWQLGSIGRWTNPLACMARDRVMKLTLGGIAYRQHKEEMAYEF